jgi:hypothetical protein
VKLGSFNVARKWRAKGAIEKRRGAPPLRPNFLTSQLPSFFPVNFFLFEKKRIDKRGHFNRFERSRTMSTRKLSKDSVCALE